MMKEGQFKMRAAAAVMAAAIAFGSSSFAAFAATGTVTGDAINVRSDASTSSSIVGTANSGDVLEVGDSKDDDSGNTWYQVTLSDGNTGYIRYDFIEVTEDEASTEDTEAATEDAEAAAADTATTATQETGDYQVVQAPDDDGNMTYYLYNNAAGERMKISDIEALQTRVSEAETAAQNAGNKYRIILIVLAVLLVLAVALCIVLFLRMRDAMTNGRRERDLTRERADQRRRSGNADDLSAVKRRQREDRRSGSGSSRSDAYASGTRRRSASGSDRPARSSEDYSRVREGARPVRTGSDQQRETGRRPASEERRAASSDVRQRSARPISDDGDVRTSRVRSSASQADGSYSSRDSYSDAPAQRSVSQDTSAARVTRQQAKNFADDDDFDYDFISLDDK